MVATLLSGFVWCSFQELDVGHPTKRRHDIQFLHAARQDLAALLDSQRKLVGIVTDEDIIRRLVQNV